jgi:acetoacetyl-CoA reductase/3-oxoacyl-[acyl-carrier protein] reductase
MVDAVSPAIQTIIKGKIPMGRFAHAEEIAKAVLFLVADGDFITGQQINVNGGVYM